MQDSKDENRDADADKLASAPLEGMYSGAESEINEYTTQASSVARTLGIAGLGIVWLYADTGADSGKLSASLLALSGQWWFIVALIAFIVALTLDVSQYLYASWRWSNYEYVASLITTEDSFEKEFDNTRLQAAWSSSAGLDIANHVTRVASKTLDHPDAKLESASNAAMVARARSLLRLTTADCQSNWQGASEFTREISDRWAPPRIVRGVNRIFWLKLVATTVGYLALAIAVIILL